MIKKKARLQKGHYNIQWMKKLFYVYVTIKPLKFKALVTPINHEYIDGYIIILSW